SPDVSAEPPGSGVICWANLRVPSRNARASGRKPRPARLRRPVRFEREPLAERLSPFVGPEPTIVVVEGVLMYVTQAQRNELLRTLKACYPRHTLYCDLMRESFADSYGREIRAKLSALGAA